MQEGQGVVQLGNSLYEEETVCQWSVLHVEKGITCTGVIIAVKSAAIRVDVRDLMGRREMPLLQDPASYARRGDTRR